HLRGGGRGAARAPREDGAELRARRQARRRPHRTAVPDPGRGARGLHRPRGRPSPAGCSGRGLERRPDRRRRPRAGRPHLHARGEQPGRRAERRRAAARRVVLRPRTVAPEADRARRPAEHGRAAAARRRARGGPVVTGIYTSQAGARAVEETYRRLLAGWPVPAEHLRVPTREGETFVVASGPPDAPPLVLLHGSGSNASMWAPDVAAWSERFRVYAVDVIGEPGRS